MTIKEKARKTKEFAQAHTYEIVYVGYIVGCVALGYWTAKKVANVWNADVQRAVEHETLRVAVAAGHEFRFDPKTDLLWDVTLRPDMKAG